MNSILSGLPYSEYIKFMHYITTKETWDKLQKDYEGDDNVKQVKLQTHKI